MIIEYFGVHSHPADSGDYLRLRLGGSIPVSRSLKIAIERPGQNRPYLAGNGWQSNYTREVIEVLFSDAPTFDLRLPMGLARFLDSEHNYKVELFDMVDNSLGAFGMNWLPPPRAIVPAPPPKEPDEERVPDEPVHEPDALVIVIPEPVVTELESEPVQIKRPTAVNRTVETCSNCGGQIFSTFAVCPYCRAQLRKR